MKQVFCLVLMVLLAAGQLHGVSGVQFTGGTVSYRNVSLFSSPWEVAVVELDFDGDIYVQDRLVCPYSSAGCPAVPTCQACDLAGSQACASAAALAQCCGIAADPDAAGDAANLNEWCAAEAGFTALSFGVPSDPVTLGKGESATFRFFLPPSAWCTPFRIYVRPVYGSLSAFISNSVADPGPSQATWKASDLGFGYGYAQSTVDVCPSHPSFLPGTYALTVVAMVDSQFVVELFLPESPQPYLPPPAPLSSGGQPLTCWDHLEDVGIPGAFYQNCTENGLQCVSACLNDGETQLVELAYAARTLVVFLIDQGCHTIGFSALPHPDDARDKSTDPDIFCVPIDSDRVPFFDNAAMARWRVGGDHATMSVCLEEPTLMYCAIQAWIPGRVHVTAATRTPSLVRLITDFSRYDLAVSAGISSAALVFWDPTYHEGNVACVDLGSCALQWTTYPAEEPLFFWPPPIFPSTSSGYVMPHGVPTDFGQVSPPNPRRIVLTAVMSAPTGRSTIPREVLEMAGTAQAVFLTDADGVPLQMPNDGPLAPSLFSNVAFSSLTVIDPECDTTDFKQVLTLADKVASQLEASQELTEVLQFRYYLDLYLETASFVHCSDFVQSLVEQQTVNAVYPLPKCNIDPSVDPVGFERDPCCNVAVEAIQCCSARSSEIAVQQFSVSPSINLDQTCGFPICAESFLQDLTHSLNTLQNPTSGCSTAQDSNVQAQHKETVRRIRQCREDAGIGRDFQGVGCAVDADCTFPPFQCDRQARKCMLSSDYTVTQDIFLRCVIDTLSVSFDDWLRNNILPPSVASLPATSSQFLAAFHDATTIPDCVGRTLADMSSRTRWLWDALDSYGCKASTLELSSSDPAVIDPLCTSMTCLDETCYVKPQQCMRYCQASWHFIDGEAEESCALNTECNVDRASLCTASPQPPSACAYCPPDGSPCLTSDLSQSQCASGDFVACELPSGQVLMGLSAAQCQSQASACSEQCYDASSRTWVACTSEGQCLTAGYCTDRDWALSQGNCFQSGYVQEWIPDRSSECDGTNMRTPNGCRRSNIATPADCVPYRNVGAATWQEWLMPSTTESQCLASGWPHAGCILIQENRTMWLNETECGLCGGEFLTAFRWRAGKWQTPVARSLEWVQADPAAPVTRWAPDAVSFMMIEQWTVQFAEYISSFSYRSQALCSYQLASNILKPLVCDCAVQGGEGDCYSSVPRDSVVAVSLACLGDVVNIQAPSARLAISPTSVSSSCVQLTISEISSDSMKLPPAVPSVSFAVAEKHQTQGFVRNSHDAVVGNISSNGVVVSVDPRGLFHRFTLCILIQHPLSTPSSVPDFGTLDAGGLRITPLYLDAVPVMIDNILHWCANVTFTSASQISYFAIETTPNARDQSQDLYTSTDTALIYTLAAEYIVCLVMWVIFSFGAVAAWKNGSLGDPSLLLFMAGNFALLTIFRIVYLFAMPGESITKDAVSDFAVFELPTFFYLNALCFIIAAWLEVSVESNQRLVKWSVVLGTHIISYALFVAVIVAVAVLSSQSSLVNAECPGRAPPTDSSVSAQIRDLSIAYQSIVITITVVFIILMLISALIATRKAGHSAVYRRMIAFCIVAGVGLLARCILFIIILAADFSSGIYMFITLNCTEIFVMLIICFLFPSFRSAMRNSLSLSFNSGSRSSSRERSSPHSSH